MKPGPLLLAVGADAFYDQPLSGGNGLTLMGQWTRYDGATFLTTLPRQDTYLVEAGLCFMKARFGPFVQWAKQDFSSSTLADNQQFQVGLACWMKGHNRNLKAGYGQLKSTGKPTRDQFQVQLQVSMF